MGAADFRKWDDDLLNKRFCGSPNCLWCRGYFTSKVATGAVRTTDIGRVLPDGIVEYNRGGLSFYGDSVCSINEVVYHDDPWAVAVAPVNTTVSGRAVAGAFFGIKRGGAADISHAPPGGCICARCNMKNEYAGPNQPDGTYKCFDCRVEL